MTDIGVTEMDDRLVARVERLEATAAQRVFVGSAGEIAMIRLRDRAGRDRIRLLVEPDGAARLEFLDAGGGVVHSFPE